MEKINLTEWNFMPSIVLYFLLLAMFSLLNIAVRPTRDILLENDEETKREVLASNQYIIDILEKKQTQL